MTDLTAVLLTLGEKTYPQALQGVRSQTKQPRDIITVDRVSPFHRAFNVGVSRVDTEFFVVVDSDMVLDTCCFEVLSSHLQNDVGIVVGHLRDALMGRIVGVKLFRRECFNVARLKDSISPDTDFTHEIAKAGWRTIYANDGRDFTVGEHCPEYTPLYTFSKFQLEGRRHRYRRKLEQLGQLFWRIHARKHPVALIAQVGAAHGIFSVDLHDGLRPFESTDKFEWFEKFLHQDHHSRDEIEGIVDIDDAIEKLNSANRDTFEHFRNLGAQIGRQGSTGDLRQCLDGLHRSKGVGCWIAAIALCHGLFCNDSSETDNDRDFACVQAGLDLPASDFKDFRADKESRF